MPDSFLILYVKLPDNEVTIETDATFKTTITCEKANFTIVGKSGEDFAYIPIIPRNEPILHFTVYIKGSDPPDHFFYCR